MNHKEFLHKLIEIDACSEAVEYVRKNKYTFRQAWNKCKRADWMLWLAVKIELGTEKDRIHAICDCAETTLPIFEKEHPDDERPREAIEAARNYADNPTKENNEKCLAAAEAAARAARAAAWAAEAAEAAARAARAAAWAAEAAAWAAEAAWAARAAEAAAHKNMCKLIRKRIKP